MNRSKRRGIPVQTVSHLQVNLLLFGKPDEALERVFLCVTCLIRQADLATEPERQLTTARANQTTGLANGRAANWEPEVVFSPFRALSRRQLTFPSCC